MAGAAPVRRMPGSPSPRGWIMRSLSLSLFSLPVLMHDCIHTYVTIESFHLWSLVHWCAVLAIRTSETCSSSLSP